MLERILIGFALFVLGAYHLTDKTIEDNIYMHSPHMKDTVMINFSFDYVVLNYKDSATLFTTTERPFKDRGYLVYPLHDYFIIRTKETINIMDNSNKMLNYYIVYNNEKK